MVQVPLQTGLQQSEQVRLRYSHLSPAHQLDAVRRLNLHLDATAAGPPQTKLRCPNRGRSSVIVLVEHGARPRPRKGDCTCNTF